MRKNLTTIEQLCFALVSLVVMCLVAVAVVGCGGSGNHGGGDAGGNGSDDMAPSCARDPQTHLEIINACTDSQSVDIQPFYPAKAPNGQLPPLP